MATYCQRFQKSTVSAVDLTVKSTIESNANVILRLTTQLDKYRV